jgi:hypothetical protein
VADKKSIGQGRIRKQSERTKDVARDIDTDASLDGRGGLTNVMSTVLNRFGELSVWLRKETKNSHYYYYCGFFVI